MDRRLLLAVLAVLGAALGGIPRLISVLVEGWPHPVFIGTLVLELGIVPVVIWWHSRVFPARRSGDAATA